MNQLLVTGSSGLIGSEVCVHFAGRGWQVVGLDNNQRAVFFGPQGDTRWNQRRLQEQLGDHYRHIELDICDRQGVLNLLAELKPDAIVHTAAQPSHDRAAAIPFDDFDTNAVVGTLNLLEATRQSCPQSPFVHLSTKQGLRRSAQCHCPPGARHALRLRRSGLQQRHRGRVPDRPEQALAVRRLQGGGRCDGAGIRPLLRHAQLLPAEGGAASPGPTTAAWSCIASSAIW
jgi:NAD(P)-dependent dehydrogenase (short-subunit alcohol dehydrogenase family)